MMRQLALPPHGRRQRLAVGDLAVNDEAQGSRGHLTEASRVANALATTVSNCLMSMTWSSHCKVSHKKKEGTRLGGRWLDDAHLPLV
jgi:hypothetical protein